MTRRVEPWEPGYSTTSNPVPAGVTVPWTEQPPGTTTVITPTPAEPAVTTPVTTPVTPSDVVVSSDLAANLEKAVLAAAEGAAKSALPGIISQVQKVVSSEVSKVLPPAPTAAPTISLTDLTKSAARGRALRSLAYGSFLTALWALVSILGALGGINWFTHEGLVAGVTLIGGTVAHAVLSYLGRIVVTPSTPE